MGLKYSVADPDICYNEATKSDCEEYYKYILVYMDDLIAISLDSRSIILEVSQKLKLNKGKIDPPEVYLGGKLSNN